MLGIHGSQIVEYDEETLSPSNLKKMWSKNREVFIVDDSRAMVLIDLITDDMEVVHPN